MKKQNLSYHEALANLKSIRSDVKITPGFEKQLIEWHK